MIDKTFNGAGVWDTARTLKV
ncbi:hypothetical protein DXZ79_07610 [Yersinia rochesterensis]|uniref:Insertion element IS1 protein InsA helix-turn-helix domain-containing protein n=1 Tax=Yersinia rochesterensis TaxID=1604335 RepID=A0A8E3ZHQ7_9GAMM|nr:hypothetical protein DXZ79_07610 [Yersinia rochesterensis]